MLIFFTSDDVNIQELRFHCQWWMDKRNTSDLRVTCVLTDRCAECHVGLVNLHLLCDSSDNTKHTLKRFSGEYSQIWNVTPLWETCNMLWCVKWWSCALVPSKKLYKWWYECRYWITVELWLKTEHCDLRRSLLTYRKTRSFVDFNINLFKKINVFKCLCMNKKVNHFCE